MLRGDEAPDHALRRTPQLSHEPAAAYGVAATRAKGRKTHPDLNKRPADLQSAAVTTEL